MGSHDSDHLQILGLTGSFGSGCSYIAQKILESSGYRVLSLSSQLKKEFSEKKGKDPASVARSELQDFGDELRRGEGGDYLARRVWESISDAQGKWVIDSIRNPAEIHYLRRISSEFFLFGVFASRERRWERIKEEKYQRDRRKFDEDDERDTGRHSEADGQRVEDCFAEADVVISNDRDFAEVGNRDFEDFHGRLKPYIDRISKPLSKQQPTERESLMAAAYTVSQRSSCLQRKVGAVIADDGGNIVSSGFNEVPAGERPCFEKYTICGRRRQRNRFQSFLETRFPPENSDHAQAVMRYVRENFRMLDQCRALHAEENAIVNLARNGRSIPLDQCTLYTTTYPCRLCANKIVNLGLKRLVYLEPYPDPVAKEILAGASVEDEFFEGITFKAYSRIYGDRK